jgi:hypothetical protein
MSHMVNWGALAQGQEQNPATLLAQTLMDVPKIREQQQDAEAVRQDASEQRAAAAQARQNQAQTDAMAMFNNKKQFFGQQLLADPTQASNPQMVEQVSKAYQDAGIPAPLDDNGHVKLDDFKKGWDQTDDKLKQFIAQLPPEQRKPFLDQYSGVPKNLYTTNAFVSAKDQAGIAKTTTWIKNQDERTAIMDANSKVKQQLATATESMDWGKVAEIRANTSRLEADTANIAQRTAELPQKLANETARLGGYLQSVQQAGLRGQARFSGINMVNRQAKDIIGVINHTQSERDNLTKSQAAYLAAGGDPDSPQNQAWAQQINGLDQSLSSSQESYDKATQFLLNEAPTLGTQAAVSAAGGGNVTNVESVGSKTVKGSDGLTYQQLPSGKWKVIK